MSKQDELNRILEKAKDESLKPRKTPNKRKKVKLKTKNIIIALSIISTIITAVKVTPMINSRLNDIKIDDQIGSYGSGFIDGSVKRTNDNRNFWYDFDIITEAIIKNDNIEYAFYNTVNKINSSVSLSEDLKIKNLDNLMKSLNKELENGNFCDNCDTFEDFLTKNNYNYNGNGMDVYRESVRQMYKLDISLTKTEGKVK